ncbi:MAG TPA: DUF998 domain-containing protein [Candidatus Dormibacteraeota bacterium]|nr:DUF998 domain-containing protein [Candidatus Dormibacteraeota bacterium]
MSQSHPYRSLTGLCLLLAAAAPALYFGTQVVAAPFYPGYSFSHLSASMLGTRFSHHPAIFNVGEMLTGLAALGGAFGLYLCFRVKTHRLLAGLIGFSVASTGVMCLKAGLFPMPDSRHNSWGLLFDFIILIPFLMLAGLLKASRSAGLRIYLAVSVAFLLLLIPLSPWLGRGTLQRLIAVATNVPIGVVGFSFWRELRRAWRGEPAPRVPATPW